MPATTTTTVVCSNNFKFVSQSQVDTAGTFAHATQRYVASHACTRENLITQLLRRVHGICLTHAARYSNHVPCDVPCCFILFTNIVVSYDPEIRKKSTASEPDHVSQHLLQSTLGNPSTIKGRPSLFLPSSHLVKHVHKQPHLDGVQVGRALHFIGAPLYLRVRVVAMFSIEQGVIVRRGCKTPKFKKKIEMSTHIAHTPHSTEPTQQHSRDTSLPHYTEGTKNHHLQEH